MCRIEVLLNERAASGTPESAGRIEDAFATAGVAARVAALRGDRLAEAATRAARDGTVLVAAGGDGTVSTVAGIAAETGAMFGVIPLGTLNHFAKDAGIPLDLDAAVRTIVEGHADRLDVGSANGRAFVNNLNGGLYARIVRERQLEQQRGHAKRTAFAIGLARAWIDFRQIRVRLVIDGVEHVTSTPFVFVGNGEYVTEGPDIGRRSSIANGRLSIHTAPRCTRAQMLALMVRALAGRLTPDVALDVRTAADVVIDVRAPKAAVAADGELVTLATPIRCTVRPGALRTLRPAR